jgi:hypothetical protein
MPSVAQDAGDAILPASESSRALATLFEHEALEIPEVIVNEPGNLARELSETLALARLGLATLTRQIAGS